MNRQPAPSPKRARGRPSADGSEPRERLLDTALALFARDGIRATSLRGIAQGAGVTPAMLNYYFGDKPRLLDALLDERLLPLVHTLSARLQDAGEAPLALASALVQGIASTVRSHPWLPPLWVREILCDGGMLREPLISRAAPLVPLLLAERFAVAQQRGRLNPALDPRLLVVSLIGLSLLPYAAEPLWRPLFADPALGDDALLRHTLGLLEHGLEVPDAP
ncbi:TetR/AcrR family transcriptional regulator [Pseudomonas sp. UL073]|uniref:TetR/AcrR family transcriptional regulator n=1 Tax=Zestomonas insulae TaxID=2809017 RepID=A0ABS2IGV1_9GAMM|nr:TetR/AcrR family transcriptional regulator [Pseudomonas insulae]MBM7062289.1 TetR/AcrR family transcriptional regulator [Pseudomonas insulae]